MTRPRRYSLLCAAGLFLLGAWEAQDATAKTRAAAGKRPAATKSRRASSAGKARANKGSKGKIATLNFDDLLIDGDFQKPALLFTRALKSPKFERLLRLRKSFLPRLLRSARFPDLRRAR